MDRFGRFEEHSHSCGGVAGALSRISSAVASRIGGAIGRLTDDLRLSSDGDELLRSTPKWPWKVCFPSCSNCEYNGRCGGELPARTHPQYPRVQPHTSFSLAIAMTTDLDSSPVFSSIMLVDDSTILRDRLAEAFQERGFRVSVAGTCDEAV